MSCHVFKVNNLKFDSKITNKLTDTSVEIFPQCALTDFPNFTFTFQNNRWQQRQPTCKSTDTFFWKQEAELLPRDHAMRNVNPNLNPNRNPNWSLNCAVTVAYLTDYLT